MASIGISSDQFSPSDLTSVLDELQNDTSQDESFSVSQFPLQQSSMIGMLVFLFCVGTGLVVGVTLVCLTSPKPSMSSIERKICDEGSLRILRSLTLVSLLFRHYLYQDTQAHR